MQIKALLQAKGAEVVTVSREATVSDLVALLAEHNIGAVVVTGDGDDVAGIVSERDVVRRLTDGPEVLERPVGDIMTSEVQSAQPHQTVHELARLMTEHRVRHVPVMEDGALIGIVSIGDVVKSRIDELEFERDQLESYVSNAQ
jgi:CBS domain-containing protein